MTENIEVLNEKSLSEQVVGFGRGGLYLGLGIAGVVRDNVAEWVKRGQGYGRDLVVRGEKIANANRGKVTDLVEKPQTVVKDTAKRANETFDKYSEQVLSRANIPTSNQIDGMTKKVTAVDRKLDKMIKESAVALQN